MITADEDQVKQVVMNVVLNAIQCCNDEGVVRLASYRSAVQAGGDGPEPARRKPSVCIEVSDNGRGIDKDIMGHIFDPFFTTKRDGTGLGLSIAHQIITRHGGYIDVRSTPGRGTSFYVHIPIDPPAVRPAPEPVYEAENLRLHG